MKRSILIRPEAEMEIEEAYHWYEQKHNGLGSDFLLCMEEGIEKILSNPDMCPVVYRNIQRLLIRRFPYGIFYTTKQNLVIVVAVFRGHRNPKQWKSRS
jgi:toxin ParE1/3/4